MVPGKAGNQHGIWMVFRYELEDPSGYVVIVTMLKNDVRSYVELKLYDGHLCGDGGMS